MTVDEIPVDAVEQPEEETSGGGGAHLVLWLVILSLSIFLAPLYLVSVTLQENTATLAAELAGIEATLQITPQADAGEEALRETYMQLQGDIQELEGVQTALTASQFNLPQIMAAIATYDPAQLRLTTITQAEAQLTVSGSAVTEAVVLDYIDVLVASDLFTEVSVQSIQQQADPQDAYTADFVLLVMR